MSGLLGWFCWIALVESLLLLLLLLLLLKLHNEELSDQYSTRYYSGIKSRIRWAEHAACMGEKRCEFSVLVWKPEGRKPLGRPRRRWEDDIKMGHSGSGMGGVGWIDLDVDRDRWRAVVNAVMDLRVP